MATQLGPASVEAPSRRTRDKPLQSYRDLMNPLRSKDYITGKKGLPRSERTLGLSPNPGSVPVSPTDASSSDNGSWTQRAVRRTSRTIKARQPFEEDSSPEVHPPPSPSQGLSSPAFLPAVLSQTQSAAKLTARVEISGSKTVLIISGLKPFHWTRFRPQIHMIEDMTSDTRIGESDDASYISKKTPVPRRSTKVKIISRAPASATPSLNDYKEQIEPSVQQDRPGLVRLSLKRKLPEHFFRTDITESDNSSKQDIRRPEVDNNPTHIEDEANVLNKTTILSEVAAGKQPIAMPPLQDEEQAEDTVSDTTSESSEDVDFSTWVPPVAYHDFERPVEEDCEDAADFVLRSRYKPLPDVTAFASVLAKRIEKRSTTDLYKLLQSGNDILRLWQDEYIKLDRITAPHSITQRRPVLGGRVPIEAQIFEDIKESILYDYVYDPRKPPGQQDPIGQKAKSTALSRELRQRRKRKLDLDQSDEPTIEPYRTRRQVAVKTQIAPQKLDRATSPLSKSSPQASNSVQIVKKRGRPAKERDVNEDSMPDPRGPSTRGRGGAQPRGRGRGRGRPVARGRSRGLAIRYEDDNDATASDDITADEAMMKTSASERVDSVDMEDELGDVTSKAFDRARSSSAQQFTVKGSKLQPRDKKSIAKSKAQRVPESAGNNLILKTVNSTGKIQVKGLSMKDPSTGGPIMPSVSSSERLHKDLVAKPSDQELTARQSDTTTSSVLPSPGVHSRVNALAQTGEAVSFSPKPSVKPTVKRKRSTTNSKPAMEGSAISTGGSRTAPASSAPKGKRRRAVSTNTSYPGRNIIPMQIIPTAQSTSQSDQKFSTHAEVMRPPPMQLSWPVAIAPTSSTSIGNSNSNNNNSNHSGILSGGALQSQAAATRESLGVSLGEQGTKNQGLKIRVPSRKTPKDPPPSAATGQARNKPVAEKQQNEAGAVNTESSYGIGFLEPVPGPVATPTAAQAASARLTKSLIEHASQSLHGSEILETSTATGAAQIRNSSEDQTSSSGDAAAGSMSTASAQKVDKRRLKKPPSQLRSETMTKWWADRKAKKQAEKESLKNLQARSQERMLLAGDANRPSVNPFMLGERPLLAFTPLSTEGSSGVLPSPTAGVPSYQSVQSPGHNIFPRAPSDSSTSMSTQNQYPYSVPQLTMDGRSPSSTHPTSQSRRNDHKVYNFLRSPDRPPSPREDRRQSTYARPEYSRPEYSRPDYSRPEHIEPSRPFSPQEPFRPPTLPSLSQITDPSYQANGSGFSSISSRDQHTYPQPPTPLRPIDRTSMTDTRPPHVYPHRADPLQTHNPPTYPLTPQSRQTSANQYSTWPPSSSTASQETFSYYPSRTPIPPQQNQPFDQNSGISSIAPLDRLRHDDHRNYSHYPPHPPSQQSTQGLSSSQSYWPPGPSQTYPRRHTPPPPPMPRQYPSQQSHHQYPPPHHMDRPTYAGPARSPIEEPQRYLDRMMTRDDQRMFGVDNAERDQAGSNGPPIDPELLG